MRHSKSAQLETAPTKYGGKVSCNFFEFTIIEHSQYTASPSVPTVFHLNPQTPLAPLVRGEFLKLREGRSYW